MTDPRVFSLLAPPAWLVYAVEAALAAGVVVLALLLKRRRTRG